MDRQPEATSPLTRPPASSWATGSRTWGLIAALAAVNLIDSMLLHHPEWVEWSRYTGMVHVVAPQPDDPELASAGRCDFWIDRDEVTNEQFAEFVRSSHYRPQGNHDIYARPGRERYPVVGVTQGDAAAYAAWLHRRLPTALEWERAYGSDPAASYPWGPRYQAGKANINTRDAVPVGTTAGDISPLGVRDLAGNVMEWTASVVEDPSVRRDGTTYYGVKGCAWALTERYAGKVHTIPQAGSRPSYLIGFRCVAP